MSVRFPRSTAVAVLAAVVLMLAWGPQQHQAFCVAAVDIDDDVDSEPLEPVLTKEHLLDAEYMAEMKEMFDVPWTESDSSGDGDTESAPRMSERISDELRERLKERNIADAVEDMDIWGS